MNQDSSKFNNAKVSGFTVIPFSTIVDTVERCAGLNICGFSAIEAFMEIFFRCLGHKCSLLVQLKRGAYIHGKTFGVLLKTVKNAKVSPANLSCLQ